MESRKIPVSKGVARTPSQTVLFTKIPSFLSGNVRTEITSMVCRCERPLCNKLVYFLLHSVLPKPHLKRLYHESGSRGTQY